MLHQKILRDKIVFYRLPLGPSNYFRRGSYFVFGKFHDSMFSCYGKSGSQNLWLPRNKKIGLKIFHPKGFSGTLQNAWNHFKVQKLLADVNLAPKPLALYIFIVSLIGSGEVGSPWRSYGMLMDRILCGSLSQTLRNLRLFRVKITPFVAETVNKYLLKRNSDALNLYEYQRLCTFFGGNETSTVEEISEEIKERLPSNIDVGDDLFALPNIVLNENGEVKIIDCDLARIKVC